MSMTLGACDQSLFRLVDLCLGCSCVQVATRLFDPMLAWWHKADISQAPDAGKTLSVSSSQRLLHIFKPKHGHFSSPICYRSSIYQQKEQHYARLEAKLYAEFFALFPLLHARQILQLTRCCGLSRALFICPRVSQWLNIFFASIFETFIVPEIDYLPTNPSCLILFIISTHLKMWVIHP